MPRTKQGAWGARISISGTTTILNPWHRLPAHVISVPGVKRDDNYVEITSPTRLELKSRALSILFRRNEVIFAAAGDSREPLYLVNPILYFLIYKTFVNYNAVGYPRNMDETSYQPADCVRFNIERIVRVENKTGFHHAAGRPEVIELTLHELIRYTEVLNPALYYALAFYLIGCENPRYFLVEFYKAFEVIKNAFGGEHSLLKALEPYGVNRRSLKEFGQWCNDVRKAPLDIGRHAPVPGAPLWSIDLRNLLIEPRSREVFESSTLFCRQVIDAYIEYLSRQS